MEELTMFRSPIRLVMAAVVFVAMSGCEKKEAEPALGMTIALGALVEAAGAGSLPTSLTIDGSPDDVWILLAPYAIDSSSQASLQALGLSARERDRLELSNWARECVMIAHVHSGRFVGYHFLPGVFVTPEALQVIRPGAKLQLSRENYVYAGQQLHSVLIHVDAGAPSPN